MHKISIGKYTVVCDHKKSYSFEKIIENAVMIETLICEKQHGEYVFYGITDCGLSPDLVIEGNYSPSSDAGFYPGLLIIPEEDILFFGAGDVVQVWNLAPYQKIDEYVPDCGFWSWSRSGDVVLMSGELELAGWDIKGKKLWSRYVEPPWYFTVHNDIVTTNVMDHEESFNIYTGK